MAEFKLDRFKYNWKGDWQADFAYKRDDIVRVNGKSYVCLLSHTSSPAFRTDLYNILPGSEPPQPQPYWTVMTSGRSFVGEWTNGVDYNQGDLVLLDGTVWECTTSHTAGGFAIDYVNWKVHAKHIKFVGDWNPGTQYGHGAIVRYGGKNYKCLIAHQSGGTLEDNFADWEVFQDNVTYAGEWETGTSYKENDLVKWGGSLWRCIETHTSTGTELDLEKFQVEYPGYQFNGIWNSVTLYQQGDVVKYGGQLYYSVSQNIDSDPSRFADDSTVDWILLAETYNFRGYINVDEEYKQGDVIQRGGDLYRAIKDINSTQGDYSTLDYLDDDTWELIIPGKKYDNVWTPGKRYFKNDVVYYLGTAYVANIEHESDTRNFPGDNGSGIEYWDVLIQAGRQGGLDAPGDMLTYGLSRTLAGDESTLGDTRIPIGTEGQVLSITAEQEAYWRDVQSDSEVVYVSNLGDDEIGYGLSENKPFATVRYACEFVEDTYPAGTLVTIKVATGYYEEIGPLSVPAGCAIVGDELRATTIAANKPIEIYQNDYNIHDAMLVYVTSILYNIATNTPVDVIDGVTEEQQIYKDNITNFDPYSNFAVNMANKFATWREFVNFRLNDGDTDPEMTGSNENTADQAYLDAIIRINLNLKFIIDQAYNYLVAEYPNNTIIRKKVRDDVRHILKAAMYDVQYVGTYRTIRSAKRYVNAVLGSQLQDLIYVRNATGVRQLSTKGLEGSLNPPGVYDLYQRPTGGALISLDPGWGPDDETVWITSRSPYIQGVTNIGERCVGQKVDGALHNGGLKSLTSNDFTQVLSDGIGAWITNNARAELVSVFTYYCQVGYLAENGGVIRAANGNNSYGSWGSIADGNDPNEIPDEATVDNRNNEAQVAQALSGDTTDKLFIFEYTNAGEEYTTADASIVGAGADADVEFTDFRDGALFEARLINTRGSGKEGGSNYLTRGGSAQETTNSVSTIKLSASDTTQFEEEIIGMRILIVAGDGAGQYGYIDAYDPVSRNVTVRRDSDGELGWDHVIPGTPIKTSLQSTAIYRIEPRVVASAPSTDITSANLTNSRTIADLDFGGMTEIYNVTASQGTGETFDDAPQAAQLEITRAGSTYSVRLVTSGLGYARNDIITISGDLLGGTSPENDCTIIVDSVTDDSSNSIATYSVSGNGRAGRYVAIAQPNFVVYSDDAVTWSEANTSFIPDDNNLFVKILAGKNRFVAIPENENRISFSYTGETWFTRALPTSSQWVDGVFGHDKFVVIASDSNKVVYSEDGLDWSETAIPDNLAGDSSTIKWDRITYGQGKWVAVSANFLDIAYSTDAINWTRVDAALPVTDGNFVTGLAYGNNRFVAIKDNGKSFYSLDGITWYEGTDIATQVFQPESDWVDVKYANGVFVAIHTVKGGTTTNTFTTSEDGINWTERGYLEPIVASAVAYAPDNGLYWTILGSEQTGGAVCRLHVGKRALLRADVFQGTFQSIKVWDPGSGYSTDPTITVSDNQFITEAEIETRMGDGVLAQPDFINRGSGYRSSTSTITITGDGYADIIEQANRLTLTGVNVVPGPGVQIRIAGILDPTTEDPDDLFLFNGVTITDLGDDGTGQDTRKVEFQISPRLENEFNLQHGTQVFLRSNYSQCRISGHDFLDIGTGNFEETNYPEIYAGGALVQAAPENEVYETNGGRVFYVSTDQGGNFRAGELFSVQQATGIVTISAEFFDLDGLSELSLGGVRLGGSGASVREFSTDPTFSEDSNNVVPTQRAIATFLADRLSVGGEALETNDIQAGRVKIGTTDNRIDNNAGEYVDFNSPVTFDGEDDFENPTDVQGTIVSQMLFLRQSFDESML